MSPPPPQLSFTSLALKFAGAQGWTLDGKYIATPQEGTGKVVDVDVLIASIGPLAQQHHNIFEVVFVFWKGLRL